ncbi:RNA polymerase-binding protein DksA, partial [Stenotrophomonas pavanii]|uniref:RNA polymerase-binding protein DksA n=2 Tax=Stenotrophomonas pavanii TaxID=487698 RepID=UPI0039C7443A
AKKAATAAKKTAKPVVKKLAAKPVAKKPASKPVSKAASSQPAARKATAKKAPAKATKPVAKKAATAPAKAKPAAGKKAPVVKKATSKAAPAKKAAAKPVASKAAAKPAPKATVKKAAAKPVAKPAAKKVPAAKPVATPAAAKKVAKNVAAPAAKPTPAPVVKSAPKPAAKAAPAKPVPAKTVAVAAAQPASKPAPAAAPAAATATVLAGTGLAGAKAPQSKNPVPVSKSPAKSAVKSDSAPKTVSRPVGKVAVAVAARSAAPAPRSKYKVVEYKTDEATGRPILPAGYKPSSEEEYMSPLQQEYFRQRLQNWRADLVEESKQTIENLREEVRDIGDEAERATRETENSLELRTRDRYRKLIGKIDSTLKRLEAGDYGYCVDTGEEIGLERLEARLTAERTIDAQERWEHLQKQQGD